MEALYKVNAQVTIKVEAATSKELFSALAEVEEIFGAETSCGHCHNTQIKFRVRTTQKGDKFYELFCPNCTATFDFGQKKDNKSIYPKRKDDDQHGWSIYQRQREEANV